MVETMKNVQMLQCPACGEFTLHPKRKELGYHVDDKPSYEIIKTI